jgi:glutathione synthase/RimK-type ligase-like ATP-grasp enzyme
MIVLWGIGDERPIAAVRNALAELGHETFVLDQRDVFDTSLEITFGAEVTGRLVGPAHSIDLSSITAIYSRPYDPTAVPSVVRRGKDSGGYRHAVELHQAFRAWTEVTRALVVNRVTAMSSNSSKPYQCALVRSLGFKVPETLVTNDPEVARVFLDDNPHVVYKSVSDVRSVVARVTDEHRARLADIVGCPTQFQVFVPGTDVRVHVVGDRLFPVEVSSAATDYRYPGEHEVTRTITELPDDIAQRCRDAARGLGLPLAGIDLRRTDDGDWYCFEVNPAPAFPYYDLDGGIARAVAELLAGKAEPTGGDR